MIRVILATVFMFFMTNTCLLFSDSELALEKSFAIQQVTLKNGMKIFLKPTVFEPGEISVNLIAEGGFSLLDEAKRGSGELAAQVAWESGLGNLTSDQLSVLLYEHSIEFNAQIKPFSRSIEASSDVKDFPELLKLIRMYFTEQNFNEEAFQTVMQEKKTSLNMPKNDQKLLFEDSYKVLNTQNYHFLKPFKQKYVDNADLSVLKDFFQFAFGDPSSFVAVIVGNFDPKSLLSLLDETLGSIPAKHHPLASAKPPLPSFPKGVTTKAVTYSGRKDSLARLTFPLSKEMEQGDFHLFDLSVRIFENKLRETLTKQFKSSHSVTVSYELPLYPLLKSPWMVIQYRAEPKKVAEVHQVIIKTLKDYQAGGATHEELAKCETTISKNEEYWLKDNDYWLATLSNYALWGWDTNTIKAHPPGTESHSPAHLKKVFESYLPINNYTWIYSQP